MQVFSAFSGEEVGKISKHWTGFVKETFTDADNFGISFPYDLDVKLKAVLLAALFLIVSSRSKIFLKLRLDSHRFSIVLPFQDFMFFEKIDNKENDMPGMWS